MELFYSKYLDDGEYGDESLQNGIISGFLGKDREITSNNIEFHGNSALQFQFQFKVEWLCFFEQKS